MLKQYQLVWNNGEVWYIQSYLSEGDYVLHPLNTFSKEDLPVVYNPKPLTSEEILGLAGTFGWESSSNCAHKVYKDMPFIIYKEDCEGWALKLQPSLWDTLYLDEESITEAIDVYKGARQIIFWLNLTTKPKPHVNI